MTVVVDIFIELKQRLHCLNLPSCPFFVEASDGITHHGTHVATVVLRFVLEHLRLIRSETDFQTDTFFFIVGWIWFI